MLVIREKTNIFAPQLRTMVLQFAQVAESVDALVSNTSGFTSIPVRPRAWVQTSEGNFGGFFIACLPAHATTEIPPTQIIAKKNGRTQMDSPNFAKLTQYT